MPRISKKTVQEENQPTEQDLSIVGVTPGQWQAATPEQRRKIVDDLNATKDMAAGYEQKRAAANALGRLSMMEAAKKIAAATGSSDVKRWIDRLASSAEKLELKVYLPGETGSYLYSLDSPGGAVSRVIMEATSADLNTWLGANEPLCTFRFDDPTGQNPNKSRFRVSSGTSVPAETPDDRARRLAARRDALKKVRKKAWQQQIAREEGLSTSAIKQVLRRYDKLTSESQNKSSPFGQPRK